VALAGVEALRDRMRGKTVAAIVCGRNIDARKYFRAVAPYGVKSAE
jgi:threonine dehydratase